LCSDDFGFDDDDPTNDGWSDGGRFPNPEDHPEWRLVGAEIVKKYEDDLVTPKDWCDDGELAAGVSDSDDANYIGEVAPAAIDIEKEVRVITPTGPPVPQSAPAPRAVGDWFDADDPTGPSAIAGVDEVEFRFTITNTGGVPLTDLDVFELANTNYTFTFPQDIIEANDPLPLGASFSFILGPFPAEEGQHFNEVKVTAVGDTAAGSSQIPDEDGYIFLFDNNTVATGPDTGGDVVIPGFLGKFHLSCSDEFLSEKMRKDDPSIPIGYTDKVKLDDIDDPNNSPVPGELLGSSMSSSLTLSV